MDNANYIGNIHRKKIAEATLPSYVFFMDIRIELHNIYLL